jgi:hypothetical protein
MKLLFSLRIILKLLSYKKGRRENRGKKETAKALFYAITLTSVGYAVSCAGCQFFDVFNCAWWAKWIFKQCILLHSSAFYPPGTAECASAALRNKDGGRP